MSGNLVLSKYSVGVGDRFAHQAEAQLRTKPYQLDADHIHFDTVDRFLESSDFYTIDVADWIGRPAAEADIRSFTDRHPELDAGPAPKYLAAVKEAVESTAR
jgi:hypothetical protein